MKKTGQSTIYVNTAKTAVVCLMNVFAVRLETCRENYLSNSISDYVSLRLALAIVRDWCRHLLTASIVTASFVVRCLVSE
jgi:hypothetical protein